MRLDFKSNQQQSPEYLKVNPKGQVPALALDSGNTIARLGRERVTFPLACFLVAAEAHFYFCYTWGYSEQHGTFDWYPEFDKPLGPPLGEAKRDGWTYRRDFAHAAVFVDLEKQTARIDWNL